VGSFRRSDQLGSLRIHRRDDTDWKMMVGVCRRSGRTRPDEGLVRSRTPGLIFNLARVIAEETGCDSEDA
jgi:hypothetical protein